MAARDMLANGLMRRIVVLSFISLDGVMQAPGGPDEDTSDGFEYGGWIVPYFDDVLNDAMAKQMRKPFSLLLGRKTYEIFAGFWPEHEDDWPGVNDARKYVVSHSPMQLTWSNSVLVSSDVAGQLAELKTEDGPDIQVHGSGDLVQTLLKHDLVDELWLKIFPLTLGPGKRLFTDGAIPAAFALKESEVSPKGVIVASYVRAGDVETGSFEL